MKGESRDKAGHLKSNSIRPLDEEPEPSWREDDVMRAELGSPPSGDGYREPDGSMAESM